MNEVRQAILYEKLKNKNVRCDVCQRRCVIAPGKTGYCQTRINQEGKLYTSIYGIVSAVNNDPIEKKPVFHYKPGSFALSLGTYGCNFRCLFCQNWEISWANGVAEAAHGTHLSAKEAIDLAKRYQSAGIAITYNEPAIWLEYSLDVFQLAKDQKQKTKDQLYTCWVTNGYATKEAIDTIAPYLDIYRVDLKSFDDHFYQKLINVPKAATVFETTKYVHDEYPNIHIECITNIIPSWNDSDKTLKEIAKWIKKELGPKTPWHVTRFFPYAKLTNVPPTPPKTLYKAREIGIKVGLKFVYIGNLSVDEEDDTFCPNCHVLCIKRSGYSTQILAVDGKGHCQKCGEDLNII